MALNLGGIIRLTYNVKNSAGTLVNPTTATLTITQPDGTPATPTVTLPPAVTGVLVVDFTPVQAGLHSAHWATTVPTTADDDMFVAERAASLLVSVDEAVAHLRAAGVITSDADREQLQWLCLVASDAVERDLGRKILRRTATETYDGGTQGFILRSTPVVSITTVVESGTTLAGTDYLLNTHTGILYRGNTITQLYWAYGRQNVVVTYVAGYADPPRVVRDVALATVQELWQSSQQAAHPLLDETTGFPVSPAVVVPDVHRRAYKSLQAHGVA
jgi:hypothetical protein